MKRKIESVAVIGAGAAGAAAAAALVAEECFTKIRVYERREAAGGTWLFDEHAGHLLQPEPGKLAPDLDPPLRRPAHLPAETAPSSQERFLQTPVYRGLTTNVPHIAMSFSDHTFPYGPFVPHWIPLQYIQAYFSLHRADSLLRFNTAVEDIRRVDRSSRDTAWSLTLRRRDTARNIDVWYQETFDAVMLANGHYTVPWIPFVPGLQAYMDKYPGKVFHSKTYRSAEDYRHKTVVIIGNSASGYDIVQLVRQTARHPVYQSRRSRSRWDGAGPPDGVKWMPVIKEYRLNGDIVFDDGTILHHDAVDHVIYCTGYQPSFPFWDEIANGRTMWDYDARRLHGTWLHTFFRDIDTVGIVGMPRVLTFRSFEYQAVALARVWSGRNRSKLPDSETMRQWESDRDSLVRKEKRKFHDIPWDNGETDEWFVQLYELAGLKTLHGHGRNPPVLDSRTRWAIENIKKYPEPGAVIEQTEQDWSVVDGRDFRDTTQYI